MRRRNKVAAVVIVGDAARQTVAGLVAAASEARTVSAELVCEMSSDVVPPMTGRDAAKGGR
jgi:hypothetical protein